MSRQFDLEGRDSGWRSLTWAAASAAALTALIVLAVVLVWTIGRTPANSAPLPALDSSTPTPRALSFARDTPAAPPAETPAVVAVNADDDAPGAAASLTATPSLLAMTTEGGPGPAASGVIFEAADADEFASLASGSWIAADDALVNEGANAIAEPWLPLAAVPGPAFAVEAEMRVTRLLEAVCDQSFGLTGGSADARQVLGAGLLFPCGATTPRARLTDVTIWADGYNADPVLAADDVDPGFDPGDDWHTYRFELRNSRVRLLVDGVGVVTAPPPVALDPAARDFEAGIWAQGVALEVRHVAVYPLPTT
jgi:hypothetical protein